MTSLILHLTLCRLFLFFFSLKSYFGSSLRHTVKTLGLLFILLMLRLSFGRLRIYQVVICRLEFGDAVLVAEFEVFLVAT
jgi:hypothetical protein